MANDIDININAKDAATKEIKGVYTEIGSLNKQIKQEDQEWQKLALTIDKANNPVKYHTELNKHLETQIGNMAQKEELLKAAIEQSKNAKGDDTKQTEKLRSQLSSLELQQAKTKNEISKGTKIIEENSGALNRNAQFLDKHRDSLLKLGTAAAAAFTALVYGAKKATDESMELNNALIGLSSIAQGVGININAAKEAAMGLAADGLMPVTDAATGLKNLLAAGFSLDQAVQLMNAFKDAAAFGRQESLSFGDAVRSATEGVKNGNSILVDNAGITKNLSVMLQEAGFSAQDLMKAGQDAGVRMAIFNGIIKESSLQTGNAARLSGELSGQLSELSAQSKNAKAAVGDALTPSLQKIIPRITEIVTGFRDWAKENPKMVAGLIQAASAGALTITALTGIGLIVPSLIKGYQLLTTHVHLVTVAQKAFNLVAKANPYAIIVTAIAAVIAALVVLYKTNDTARYYMDIAWNSIKIAVGSAVDFILEKLQGLVSFIPGLADKIQQYRDKVSDFIDEQKVQRIALNTARYTDVTREALEAFYGTQDAASKSADKNTDANDENLDSLKNLPEAISATEFALKILDKQWEINQNAVSANANETQKLNNEKTYLINKTSLLSRQIIEETAKLNEAQKAGKAHEGEVQKQTLAIMDLEVELSKEKARLTEINKTMEEAAKTTRDYNYELQMMDAQWEIDQNTILANASETRKLATEKDYLKNKLDILNDEISDANDKLAEAQEAGEGHEEEVKKQTLALKGFEAQSAKVQGQIDSITKSIKEQTDELVKLGQEFEQVYSDAFKQALGAVGKGVLSLDQARAFATSSAFEKVGPEGLRSAYESLKSTYYQATPETLANIFKSKYGVDVPQFGAGGTVPGPEGKPQLIIAHGGETVQTKEQQKANGIEMLINIYEAKDPQKLAEYIRRTIMDMFREVGLVGG